MHGLIKGVTQLANYETNQAARNSAVDLLNGVISEMNKGIGVWDDFLKKGASKAEPGSYGGWAGFVIEKKLFEIELAARDKAKLASKGQSSLDDPLVSLAYNKLSESQTPSEACQNAMTAMQDRIGQIKELIDLVKTVKPKKQSSTTATGTAKKASGSNKQTKRETTQAKVAKKKSAKQPAKKVKTKQKASVKKKSAKKASTKSKTAKKKPAKKKTKK